MNAQNPESGWRQRGYSDAAAGRAQRAPLRDDGGKAYAAYMQGYRRGLEARGQQA